MIFAEARYDAIRMLEHLTETGLPPGLDPDIIPAYARLQVYRVATARGLDVRGTR